MKSMVEDEVCKLGDAPRVGFLVSSSFYHAMLDPVYELLKDEFPCLMTEDTQSMVAFAPRVMVTASMGYAYLRLRLPQTAIVWTRHGFAYNRHAARNSITGCDFACVSSEWVRDEFTQRGWNPRLGYWITGFVPMDSVLNDTFSASPPALPESFAHARATLLYAPTWNRFLSSAEVLGPTWIDRLGEVAPDVNVIIKPHASTPVCSPKWMEMWRRAVRRNHRAYLVEDTDSSVYDYFPLADVLLSDASSVIFYYLALDRPLILVSNPRREKDRLCYDPSDPEWQWRDMGIEISREEELTGAVLRCLEHPEEKRTQRALYRERVFGNNLDGLAATKIASQIRSLLLPRPENKEMTEIIWKRIAEFGQTKKPRRVILRAHLLEWVRHFLKRHRRFGTVWRKATYRYPTFHYVIMKTRGLIAERAVTQNPHRTGKGCK